MSASPLETLLPLLDTAAFVRAGDGSFSALAPLPGWLQRLTSDTTFPFLGHILEEATAFWQRGTSGSAEWGPCAEVDDEGQEYHYMVTAITAGPDQYLVFHLDRGAERMREVLQKVRSEALTAEQDGVWYKAVVKDMQRTNKDVKDLLQQLLTAGLTPAQIEMVNKLATKCVSLMGGASELIRATTIPKV
ncbi:MAG TPA: hypothetical protein VM032_03230 [Vicinamibacterales bacterium]|nr:hypothetical protein [Vicinamibacterales bacterium]